MGKSLVIVESPAKAKTINKYLGNDYIVRSSVGHIRRLATDTEHKTKDKKENLIDALGFNPYDGKWKAHYVIDKGKKKVVDELKYLAQHADKIYLASDLDREGEAIAWHLKDTIKGDDSKYVRVTFNEITKSAITKAFENPRQIDEHMVEAQKTRQFIDKMTGFMISPVLWRKVQRGLSAGRVQSVAVKLIVDKEQEIRKFIPEEYWEVKVLFNNTKSNKVESALISFNGNDKDALNKFLLDKANRDNLEQYLKQANYKVKDIESKQTTSKPRPPFTTSTLQQAASTRLGFSTKRTMNAAQKLYEAGYITYMRTDSTAISKDALEMVRNHIQEKYKGYLPEKPNFFSNKANAQEAHECIRPSELSKMPMEMEEDCKKLFNLIRNQFIACQMKDAIYDNTIVTITTDKDQVVLRSKGRVVVFDGWTKLVSQKSNDDEQDLPELKVNEVLSFISNTMEQKFTKPPARYSEAGLIKELEKRGIGRPSTYATIITTIQERDYVELENKRFIPKNIGEVVTDRLNFSFPKLMDYDNTAKLEAVLDDIAEGKSEYKSILDKFFKELDESCETALKEPEQGGMKDNRGFVIKDVLCDVCGRPMTLRYSSKGYFLGCSGYSDKENQCKATKPLIAESLLLDEDELAKQLLTGNRCSKCNSLMHNYYVGNTVKLSLCDNKACNHVTVEKGNYQPKHSGKTCECHMCGDTMTMHTGMFGKYMKCPTCSATRKVLTDGTIAPPRDPDIEFKDIKGPKKGTYMVLRQSSSGSLYLAPNKNGKIKDFRSPTILELQMHKEQLPDKWKHYAEGPTVDEEGNQTFLRFSKFTGDVFIGSLNPTTFKPSRYRYMYIDNAWTLVPYEKIN